MAQSHSTKPRFLVGDDKAGDENEVDIMLSEDHEQDNMHYGI